jgi:hypothetical protein
MLGRLAAALAPLAAMNAAGGARSLHPDPDRVRGGAAPAVTPLEHACDSGVIRDARAVWQRWAALPADLRAALLWVAERAGAHVQAGAWSLAFGRASGPPPDRALVESSADLVASSERRRAKLQKDAAGGLTREAAEELDRVTRTEAKARAALKGCDARLRAWGEARLFAAVSTWFE